MQRVLSLSRIAEAEPFMDAKVLRYIGEGQIETFESFETFSVMAFDWRGGDGPGQGRAKILIYLDKEDLFFFCGSARAQKTTESVLDSIRESGAEMPNGQLLYRYFTRLLKGELPYLDDLEVRITDTEDEVLSGRQKQYLEQIITYHRELILLKRYYEQLDSIFEEAAANDNGLLPRDTVRRFAVLRSRAERCLSSVSSLREYVTQMREAYQAQIDIQQNDIMKVFTVVTVIFLPLTLLVGWYGMNFDMPELHWKYSYPSVIGLSVVLAVWLIVYFKKKKWF